MTAPSPNWNLVTVKGRWRNYDGTLKAGTWKVTLPARVVLAVDDSIIPAGTFASGNLNTDPALLSGMSIAVDTPASDDPDTSPQGWQATIDITFNDRSTSEKYVIPIPLASAGSGIDLLTVTLPQNLPDPQPVLIKSIPGGIAALDVDGDVVNADGEKVLPGGGGGGGGAVTSVFGRIGAVTGQSTDLTDNTSTGVALFRAASASAARTTLGLGTAATRAASSFDQSGDATTAVTNHVAATDPHGDRASAATLYVPKTRTINGHDLTANVTLTAADVGAATLDGSSHLALANAAPGTMFRVNWDGANWVYAGAAIVARPSARTDLTFFFTDSTGLAPSPSFGLFDPDNGSDLLLQTV